MNINEFIQKKDNNFIIKYKNSLYGLNTNNINTHHVFTLKNKAYINIGFFFNKKIVIDYKKFKALISKTKIIEVTDIISKNNEYILLDNFYDIKKLCKSTFYEYINKLLIDKTLLLDETTKTNIITYLNDDNIKDFINIIKKEIKKIDKAFITIGNRSKNKVFYGEIQTTKLNNIGDKVCINTFTKVSIKPNKKHFKIIFNNDLPYFSLDVNEKHILLPRNIVLELITHDTLLAKPKKPEQFKNNKTCIIKSDLYDIKKVSLSSIAKEKNVFNFSKNISGGGFVKDRIFELLISSKNKIKRLFTRNKVIPTIEEIETAVSISTIPTIEEIETSVSIPTIPTIKKIETGVGGLISYNLFETHFVENTKLKVILLLGEEHINTTHCKNPDDTNEFYSYINEYDKSILKTPNNNNNIDIFVEHTFLTDFSYYEQNNYLSELISKLKEYTQKNPTKLKIHWTDPDILYEDIIFYNDMELCKQLYRFNILNKYDALNTFENFQNILPKLFETIQSKDDLVNIIFNNEKIKIQAKKSILRDDYEKFIKTYFDDNMIFTDDNWFIEGIFKTQRLSMDFYVFFRIIRDTSLLSIEENNLILENVIFHAGNNHTKRIALMFEKLNMENYFKYSIKSLNSQFIQYENECLDFTFKDFLEKTQETIEELIEEPIEEPIKRIKKRIKNFIIHFDKDIVYEYLSRYLDEDDVTNIEHFKDINKEIFKDIDLINLTPFKYIDKIKETLKNINIYFIKKISTDYENFIKITEFICYINSIQFHDKTEIQRLINTFYIILCYHSLYTNNIELIKQVLNNFIANKSNFNIIIEFLKILNKFIKLNINKNEIFTRNCKDLEELLIKLNIIYERNKTRNIQNRNLALYSKFKAQKFEIYKLYELYVDGDNIKNFVINTQNKILTKINMLDNNNNYIKKIMSNLNMKVYSTI